MKHKLNARLVGVLLTLVMILVMILGMIPVVALPVAAEDANVIVTHDVDQIRELLRRTATLPSSWMPTQKRN